MNRVSILIPAYNAERWLSECIESALNQTHGDVEVIVVSDGSTDGTLELARNWASQGVRVYDQANAGACAARNMALAKATGEFVKFLDADDILSPDAIAVQLDALQEYSGDSWIVPYDDVIHILEAQRRSVQGSFKPPPAQVMSPVLAERIAALVAHNISTPRPLHRTDILRNVGGFRTNLKQWQEYDLHLRLALAGVRFLHVQHIGSYIRHHSSPDRITKRPQLFRDPEGFLNAQVERRQMLEASLGAPLPSSVAKALSKIHWDQTRRLMQMSAGDVVGAYLSEALYLDPGTEHAGRPFQILSRALGHRRAERLLTVARKAVGRQL